MSLCIAVTTYNRKDYMQTLVKQLRTFTDGVFDLVVVDGGSKDDSVAWCHENGVRVITGPDRGVARTKNMAIHYFLDHTECEHLIIMEDDCRVWERGWNKAWVAAGTLWEHVNWPYEYPVGAAKHQHTVRNPIRADNFSGCCTVTTRDALSKVGYMDPRFGRYGMEHLEWTWRFHRILKEKWGPPEHTVPQLAHHVGVIFEKSHFSVENYRKGIEILNSIKQDEPVYRDPWKNETEKEEFLKCFENLAEAMPTDMDVAGARCPLCGCLGSPQGTRDNVVIRNCCGILLSWTWNSEADYMAMYKSDAYHVAQQKAEGQKPYWERDAEFKLIAPSRLNLIRTVNPLANSVLDIGAGTGAFVAVAAELGWSALGLEPNPHMCEQAREAGRRLVNGQWQDAAGRFDAITMMDVMEHLTRPRLCLERLREHLNPDGVLYIEMPEAGSPQNAAAGLNWKHIRPTQHLAVYSDTAAQNLFKICKYRIEMVFRPLRGKLGKIVYVIAPRPS